MIIYTWLYRHDYTYNIYTYVLLFLYTNHLYRHMCVCVCASFTVMSWSIPILDNPPSLTSIRANQPPQWLGYENHPETIWDLEYFGDSTSLLSSIHWSEFPHWVYLDFIENVVWIWLGNHPKVGFLQGWQVRICEYGPMKIAKYSW